MSLQFMVRHLTTAVALPLFSSVLPAAASAWQLLPDSAIHTIIRERVESGRSTGIVVGLIEPDGRRRVVAYGDVRAGGPSLNGETVFEIGSITKVFTAALLASMAADGTVQLDDPVAKHLPAEVRVPARNGREITLLDLTTQVSGLPRLPGNLSPKDMTNPYADYAVEQLYAFLSAYELTRDIGESFEYSNLGVGLLGHALAYRAGKSYEDLVRERILEPLGMSSTGIALTASMHDRLTPGHDASGKVVPNWDLPTLAGAGALRSTVEDMLTFLAAHLDSTATPLSAMLKRTHLARNDVAPNMRIGMGWLIYRPFDKEIIWHNGGTGGYRTWAGFDPVARIGVVVLSNANQSIDDIGFHLLEPRAPLAPAPQPRGPRTEISLDTAVLGRYTGEYEVAPNVILTVTLRDASLWAQLTGQPPFQLFAESDTSFFVKDVDAQFVFERDAAGMTARVIIHQAGQAINARKIR